MIKATLLAAALAIGMVSSASAVTIKSVDVTTDSDADALAKQVAFHSLYYGTLATETFDNFAFHQADPLSSKVGKFVGTESDPFSKMVNSGVGTAVRNESENVGGRRSVDTKGFYLDSNDNGKVIWYVNKITKAISFFLSDVSDVNALLTVTAAGNGGTESQSLKLLNAFSSNNNGNLLFVTVLFDNVYGDIKLQFDNLKKGGTYSTNDGWGMSNPTLSAVPLPPTALLLGSAVVGAAFLRRRKVSHG